MGQMFVVAVVKGESRGESVGIRHHEARSTDNYQKTILLHGVKGGERERVDVTRETRRTRMWLLMMQHETEQHPIVVDFVKWVRVSRVWIRV